MNKRRKKQMCKRKLREQNLRLKKKLSIWRLEKNGCRKRWDEMEVGRIN